MRNGTVFSLLRRCEIFAAWDPDLVGGEARREMIGQGHATRRVVRGRLAE